jgi:undecaprenyl-diphosphatase
MIDALNQIDQKAFLWLNGQHSTIWDTIMFHVSSKPEWIPLYLTILGFVIWKYRWKSLWLILAGVLLITLSDQIANLLKASVKRLRPCKDPEIGQLVHLVNDYCSGLYGFVSGHAANSFALAIFISLLFRKTWVTICMIFWAVFLSYSRIYLGVHYPGDVIGGAILGAVLSLAVYLLVRFLILSPYPRKENIKA